MVAGASTLSRLGLTCSLRGHSIERVLSSSVLLRNAIARVGEDLDWFIDGLSSEAVQGESRVLLGFLLPGQLSA